MIGLRPTVLAALLVGCSDGSARPDARPAEVADAEPSDSRATRSLGRGWLLIPSPDGRGFAVRGPGGLTRYDEDGAALGEPVALGDVFDALALAPSGALVGVVGETCWQASIMDAAGVEVALASAAEPDSYGAMQVEVAAMADGFLVQCSADNGHPDGGLDDFHSWLFDYSGALTGSWVEDTIVGTGFDLAAAADHAIGTRPYPLDERFVRYSSVGEQTISTAVESARYVAWRGGGFAVAGHGSFCALDASGAVELCRDYTWLQDEGRRISGLASDGADRLALLLAIPSWQCADSCAATLLEIDGNGEPVAPELALADLTAPYELGDLLWSGAYWGARVGDEVLLAEPWPR